MAQAIKKQESPPLQGKSFVSREMSKSHQMDLS